MVLLPEAARYFRVSTSWKPAEGKLSLLHEDHRAEILIGSNRLIVDDYLMILSSPVVVGEGTVTMALTDSAELFSRLLGRRVDETEISSAGLTVGRQQEAVEKGNVIRSIRYISYPRFTRLIVNVSGNLNADNIEVRCLEGAGSLTIELVNFRFLQSPGPTEVGDRIVKLFEPVRATTHASLLVHTVADQVKYEVQRHNDPPRVVIDIKPVAPAITMDFGAAPLFHTQPNGWTETEPTRLPEPFPFTTVVIDAGHGGKDQGAAGRGGLLEKDVTLGIALKLKELIEKKPGMKVVLTRSGDYFVSLKERTAIANGAKNGAPGDLFISIHTNSHKSPKVGGFEAYYVSDAIDPSAEATALMENAVIEFERDADVPANADLTPILWDLQFTEFISESSELAFIVQRELSKQLNTRNRGIRQAQFIVLAGVAMPSVLVEVGFVSNRVEEAKLKTAEFRNRCAEALATATVAFKERHDMRLGLLSGEQIR
jgi:N-acetylmuramoyl-L-alanine amidase